MDKEKRKKSCNIEKQKAEDKLQESELLYRTVFKQSPDGILIIDTNGNFIEFNEVAYRQLGYTREEFERLRITDIDPVQGPDEIYASIKDVLEKGSAEFEVKHRTKEGEIRDVQVITQLVVLSGRSFFHTIWRDVTERKRMEKERYLSEIGRIATEIVHDLKGPLGAILGFAELIKDGRGKTDTAIRRILNSAEQMQKIVNSVLDFAAPIQIELREDDIADVIRRASDASRIKAEQRGVLIVVDLPSDQVRMKIDSTYVERAMSNIILNSVDASGKGQLVSITMAVEENIISVRVKDQGVGMDRGTLESVFIPFFSKKGGGTGLGMSIAKKIIEGHQGKINVESKLGSGTVVTIELPYKAKEI